MSDGNYPDYWDITLGWIPREDEMGSYAEASLHLSVETCATAEEAVLLCRKWRHCMDRDLHSIDVRRREGGRKP